MFRVFKKKWTRQIGVVALKKEVLCLFMATFPRQLYLCHCRCCSGCSHFICYFPGATRWCSSLHIAQRPQLAEGSYRCSVRTKTDFGGRACAQFCSEGESCRGMGDVLFSQDSDTKSDMGRKSWIKAAGKNPQYCACTHTSYIFNLFYTWLLCEFCMLALFG